MSVVSVEMRRCRNRIVCANVLPSISISVLLLLVVYHLGVYCTLYLEAFVDRRSRGYGSLDLHIRCYIVTLLTTPMKWPGGTWTPRGSREAGRSIAGTHPPRKNLLSWTWHTSRRLAKADFLSRNAHCISCSRRASDHHQACRDGWHGMTSGGDPFHRVFQPFYTDRMCVKAMNWKI